MKTGDYRLTRLTITVKIKVKKVKFQCFAPLMVKNFFLISRLNLLSLSLQPLLCVLSNSRSSWTADTALPRSTACCPKVMMPSQAQGRRAAVFRTGQVCRDHRSKPTELQSAVTLPPSHGLVANSTLLPRSLVEVRGGSKALPMLLHPHCNAHQPTWNAAFRWAGKVKHKPASQRAVSCRSQLLPSQN